VQFVQFDLKWLPATLHGAKASFTGSGHKSISNSWNACPPTLQMFVDWRINFLFNTFCQVAVPSLSQIVAEHVANPERFLGKPRDVRPAGVFIELLQSQTRCSAW
jgi:hypothetical protein